MEADGVVGMLSADFMTGDELLPLAQQVRPASDQEWDELQVAASTPPAPRPGEEVVLSKGLPGSGWWRLYLEPDPAGGGDTPGGWQLECRLGTGGGSASGRTGELGGTPSPSSPASSMAPVPSPPRSSSVWSVPT